jgi:RND family efflux transporter MFP subunit
MNKLHVGLLFLLALALGCNRGQGQAPLVKPAGVRVAHPVVKEITDYEDLTGRTEAKHSVEVKARVTGYLKEDYLILNDKTKSKYPQLKLGTREGTLVKKGDPLFLIDPRPYEAELAKAEATVLQGEALEKRLRNDFARATSLREKRATTAEDYDKVTGDYLSAQASLQMARASRDLAKLNKDWTLVTAPISGLVSRRFVDPENLVKADDTTLTTIVSLDPMYVYFDVDERTLLQIRHWMREGKIPGMREQGAEVSLGLADEEGFPHKGTIDFIDNKLDPGTGTLRLRGVFDNSKQVLYPGLFVRLRIQIGKPHPAVLVAERALGTDQGQKFLYLVKDKNKVKYQSVKVGSLHDGLRVVEDLIPFNLTDKALASLRARSRAVPVPDTVLKKLDPIKNKGFTEQLFRKELAKLLNKDEREKYQDHVLAGAQDFEEAKNLLVIVSGLQRVREGNEVEYSQVENMLDQRPGQTKLKIQKAK